MLLALAVAATVTLTVMTDGNILATMAPLAGMAGLWIIWVAPQRKTLLILIFLGLALDKPGDAENVWQSPIAPFGGLLLENLNKTINIDALKVSLLILLLLFLLLARAHQLVLRSPSRPSDSATLAAPMKWAMTASFLATIWLCIYGVALGGDVQMSKIQVQTFVSMLMMAYLLGSALRGTRDYKTLGIVVIVAACIKAGVAVWVRYVVLPRLGIPPRQDDYTTTHGDSMLFACAVVILVAMYLEQPVRRNLQQLVLLLPVLVAGMVANNRRLAWVQLIASGTMMLLMSSHGKRTRSILRALVYAAPLIFLYGAAGWNSSSRVFAPVQLIHSVGSSDTNRSTLYRDIENYDLVYTFRIRPILGTGFGHQFEVPAVLDDISGNFKEWRYLPHNSILGLWAFGGFFGFTGLWLTAVVGLLLATSSYGRARSSEERIAAVAAMAAIITYIIHCWGDIGFSELKSIFLVGSALAIAGQLATSTGAWPGQRVRAPG